MATSTYAGRLFLCHNSKEKHLVVAFRDELGFEADQAVFLDVQDLHPGRPWPVEVERALGECAQAMIFLGGAGWGETHFYEATQLYGRASGGSSLLLIPVLLPGFDPSLGQRLGGGRFFQDIAGIDLRDNHPEQHELTVRRCAAILRGEPFQMSEHRHELTIYGLQRDAMRYRGGEKTALARYPRERLQRARRLQLQSDARALTPQISEFLVAVEARLRRRFLLLCLASAAAFFVLILALLEHRERERQGRVAGSNRGAFQALAVLPRAPRQSHELAVRALGIETTPSALKALYDGYFAAPLGLELARGRQPRPTTPIAGVVRGFHLGFSEGKVEWHDAVRDLRHFIAWPPDAVLRGVHLRPGHPSQLLLHGENTIRLIGCGDAGCEERWRRTQNGWNVLGMQWAPDGSRVFWHDHEGTLEYLDGDTGQPRGPTLPEVHVACFGPDVLYFSRGPQLFGQRGTAAPQLLLTTGCTASGCADLSIIGLAASQTRVAIATKRSGLLLWNPVMGTTRSLGGHHEDVHALRFSVDGRWLVSAADDGLANVWDVHAPEQTAADALAHQTLLRGRLVKTLRALDVTAPTRPGPAQRNRDNLFDTLQLSPDQQTLRAGLLDRTIAAYFLGGEFGEILDHDQVVRAATGPRGLRLLARRRGEQWQLQLLQAERSLASGSVDSEPTCLDAGEDLAVAGTADGRLLHWRRHPSGWSATPAEMQLDDHALSVCDLSPNGRRVFIGSDRGQSWMWRGEQDSPEVLAQPAEHIWASSWSPDSDSVLYSDQSGAVHQYPRAASLNLSTAGKAVYAMDRSNDGQLLLVGAGRSLTLRRMPDGDVLATLEVPELDDVSAAVLLDDGQRAAVATIGGRILVFDVAPPERNGQLLASIDAHDGWIRDLRPLTDGTTLSAGDDGRLVRWRLSVAAITRHLQCLHRVVALEDADKCGPVGAETR